MATSEVKINLLGVDKTGRAFGSLNKSLAQTGARLQATGKSLARTGTRMTALATVPVALLGKSMVSAFFKQKQAVAQVEAGLKRYGGQVKFTTKELTDMASELQKVSTFGDEEILSGITTQFLTFGGVVDNLTKEQFKEAQIAALNLSTVFQQAGTSTGSLATDAVQLGKALNDPLTGLTSLTRKGVVFDETQTKMIKNFVKMGESGKASQAILDAIDKNYSGIAETQAKNDPLGQMANRLGDVKEKFGALIWDVLEPFMDDFDNFIDNLDKLDDKTKKIILAIGGGIATIGPVLGIAGLALNSLGKIFTIIAAIGVGKLALIIGAVVGLGIIIYKNWDKIKAGFIKMWEKLEPIVNTVWEFIVTAFNTIKEVAGNVWGFIENVVRIVMETIWPIVKPILERIKDAWIDIWEKVQSLISSFRKIWDALWPAIKIIAIPIIVAIGAAFAVIVVAIVAGVATLSTIIQGVFWVFEKLGTIIATAVEGAMAVFNPFVEAIVWGINKIIDAWNILNNLWNGKDIGHISLDSGKRQAVADTEEQKAYREANRLNKDTGLVTINGQVVESSRADLSPDQIRSYKERHNIPLDAKAFADGGTDYQGGLALVGERGAELVNLPRGSHVTPAEQTAEILDQPREMNVTIINQYDLDALLDTLRMGMAEGII